MPRNVGLAHVRKSCVDPLRVVRPSRSFLDDDGFCWPIRLGLRVPELTPSQRAPPSPDSGWQTAEANSPTESTMTQGTTAKRPLRVTRPHEMPGAVAMGVSTGKLTLITTGGGSSPA